MKTQHLKLNQLRFIDALKRRGKLSLAAKDMLISQPAASRTLADIEALVGREICVRHAHGLDFNEFGETLAERAKRVIGEIDGLGRDLTELADGRGGRVRVGAVTAASIAYLLPASVALREIAPHAQLHIDVEPSVTLMRRMRDGEYDFVMGRLTPVDDPSLYEVRRVGEEILSFTVRSGHPLAGRRRLKLKDLSDCDWVMQPTGSPAWTAIADAFSAERAPFPEKITYSASVLLTLATVARTNAIAAFAREVVSLLTEADLSAKVVTLDMETPAVVSPFSIILPRDVRLSKVGSRLLHLVEEQVADRKAVSA